MILLMKYDGGRHGRDGFDENVPCWKSLWRRLFKP
jgi:hypothetical protein